jgi:hypothetical protein
MRAPWFAAAIFALAAGAVVARAPAPSEVDRLAERAASLWPGWEGLDRGGPATRSPAAERVETWVEADSGAAAVAAEVASRFAAWARPRLEDAPAFADAPDEPLEGPWASRVVREHASWEAESLAAAVRAGAEAAEAVRGFVRARYRRVAAMEAPRTAALRRAETIEGLAAYTAYRALREERPESARALRDRLLEALDRAAAGDLEAYDPVVSGCALAMVLDDVCPGWRERIAKGGTALEHVLVVCLHPSGEGIPAGTDPH